MAKFTVMVTETYYKAVEVEIEASDAETAEALVRGRWDQGGLDLGRRPERFDGVAFDAQPLEDEDDGQDADL